MLLDIGPLRHNTAYRRLFASQFISGLGTMVSYVAVPWQLYQLTHSNAQVQLTVFAPAPCWALQPAGRLLPPTTSKFSESSVVATGVPLACVNGSVVDPCVLATDNESSMRVPATNDDDVVAVNAVVLFADAFALMFG